MVDESLIAPVWRDRLDDGTLALIATMPKAEIHIHLEGAIAPATVLDLARRHQMLHLLPTTDLDELQRWFLFTDFSHFVRIFMAIQSLLRTPQDFALITYACGADMARQGIRYRELTFTPYTHTHLQEKGLTIDEILQGLEEGRQAAAAEFDVEMRWIFDVPRNASFRGRLEESAVYDPQPALRTLEYAIAGKPYGVVGFGLGGNERGAPPRPFAHAFAEAKRAGLLSVPHAGETMGADSVWGCIDELQADRIGHGVRAIEDPHLLVQLKERRIPLELNPTSNICLHVYRQMADHPLVHLDRMGLTVTVNSDDPPLFNTTLCQEYAVLAAQFGYDHAGLARLARNAFVAAGVEEPVKAALLAEFDGWVDRTLTSAASR